MVTVVSAMTASGQTASVSTGAQTLPSPALSVSPSQSLSTPSQVSTPASPVGSQVSTTSPSWHASTPVDPAH